MYEKNELKWLDSALNSRETSQPLEAAQAQTDQYWKGKKEGSMGKSKKKKKKCVQFI